MLSLLIPAGVDRTAAAPVLAARGLRAFGDGFAAVLLPAYLLALGLGEVQVGLVSTATLLGSSLATFAAGALGNRIGSARLLRLASLVMVATGAGFAGFSTFWPLVAVAFFGTLNPGSSDASLFLPLEHARLAAAAPPQSRTALFARYSLAAYLFGALGALAAAVPDLLDPSLGRLEAMRAMFGFYALLGFGVLLIYFTTAKGEEEGTERQPPSALGASRPIVLRLAALFSVDSFAGGLLVNSLLALWLFERFGLSLTAAAAFFFWTGLLSAASQLAAAPVARRIGLLNTMVFTHIPSSVFLICAALAPTLQVALALLLARALFSQMDVPTRSAFVMAVVTPAERSAAASFTTVPRSLAAAAGPAVSGLLLSGGLLAAPLVACGVLKIAYDLALLAAFRGTAVEGERGPRRGARPVPPRG